MAEPDPTRSTGTQSVRLVGGFLLRVALLYGLLAVPWPGLTDAYAAVYRGAANLAFGSFGSSGQVRFRAPTTPTGRMDSEIAIGRRGDPPAGTTPHDSRLTGYLPTIQVLALVLATPLAWRRRARALAWGLLLAHAFIATRLWVTLMFFFSGDAPWCLYHPGPFWSAVLQRTFEVLVVAPTLTYIVPVFIWVGATLRREDLERLVEATRVTG